MARRRRWTLPKLILWAAALAGVGILAYLLSFPDVAALRTHNPTNTSLMDLRRRQARAAGHKLRIHYQWEPLSEISPNLVHAVVLAEDDTFYQHHGFDWEQILEAVRRDWAKRKFVYGGSTLTQQLARSLYLSPRKNLLRKAKEALITLQLERTLSKRRILELYLNVTEWGNGVFGAEAAARTYFGVEAKDLTADQAAALTTVLPNPRRWNPLSERAFMAQRRTRLLERMEAAGYVPVQMSTAAGSGYENPKDPGPEEQVDPSTL
ncbi:MAG TPA: monofunctional biosynthetic peptidoglycan transglycosylase [Elusimicrobiota bacterium]|nr:monofunctional biosynthetic peptidoglycan transglycosylase [Elusimicrobiota bacterium]